MKITFDLNVPSLSKAVIAEAMPLLRQAVGGIAKHMVVDWKESVYKAKLWQGEKDAYAQTITWSFTGEATAVVESNYKYDLEIENGRPARDLKKMLNTSLKVRISKKGSRYLYIPFRHNTPGNNALSNAMPASIHKIAKTMAPSSIVGKTTRKSGTGAFDIKTKTHLTVPQNKYKWGDSLAAGLAPKLKPHHKTDIYAGMYRFNTSTPGGAKSSSYLTFRTMSEKSPGWIVPAQPGQKIAQGVVDRMKPKAEGAFAEAIKRAIPKQETN